MVALSEFAPRGNFSTLWNWYPGCEDYPHEVLFEGPAGTGKTRAICDWINWLCWFFPGIKVYVVRQTLKSLRDSFQATFEEQVVLPGSGILRGPRRQSRHDYTWPNGSSVTLFGMDEPTRLYSSEANVVYWQEVQEGTEDAWEQLDRALRYPRHRFWMKVADCNPAHPKHWMNVRCMPRRGKPPLCLRVRTRLEDNPSLDPRYLATLRRLTGVRYKRLYLGEWCSAGNMALPDYDPALHEVEGFLEKRDDGYWWIRLSEPVYSNRDKGRMEVRLTGFAGACDWGFQAPGCFMVAGFDDLNRAWVVYEAYHTQRDQEWWAGHMMRAQQVFGPEWIACDPSEPTRIIHANDRLRRFNRRSDAICIKANNARKAGLDMVRHATWNYAKEPQLFFLKDRLAHEPDPELIRSGVVCSTDELISLPLREPEEGKRILEDTDPAHPDHGYDTVRYLCMQAWESDVRDVADKPKYEAGTVAALFDREELEEQWAEEEEFFG